MYNTLQPCNITADKFEFALVCQWFPFGDAAFDKTANKRLAANTKVQTGIHSQ